MSLSIGIVGLPNVGKSTLFNALVRGHQAKVADYPFTTIEPNVGIVEVPDERLAKLGVNLKIKKVVLATIKFIDIAGLVKNAHKGEGLGNQFLSHIREVDAIIQVLDGFSGKANPDDAKETIGIELELAGIEKPTLYILNVAEKDLKNAELGSSKWVASATESRSNDASVERTSLSNKRGNDQAIFLCAKMEEELIDLPEKEAQEYLKSYNLVESGLNRLIKESYKLLHLITFYTLLPNQVQAWSLLKDSTAPQAAAKVHTDMERGFIAAEVCRYDDLIACGDSDATPTVGRSSDRIVGTVGAPTSIDRRGWHIAKEKGKIRTEGKDYIVCDGDVMLFRFNV